MLVGLALQRGNQGAVLGIDRTDAAEDLVVMGHLLQPLTRDVAPAGDVLEKGHHVVRPLRPAERDDQDRLEVRFGERGTNPSAGGLSAVSPIGRA